MDELAVAGGASALAPVSSAELGSRLARLRSLRGAGRPPGCGDFRDVVVLCSSSRGGSSLVGEVLRRCEGLLGFSAEVNPHVAVGGLGLEGPDVLADPLGGCGDGRRLTVLQNELACDAGRPAPSLRQADPEALALHTAWRLTMQWPGEPICPERVRGWVHEALAETAGGAGIGSEREAFALALLRRARARHPGIDPYRYDLPEELVAERFPGLAIPSGPAAEPVVEMTPFVTPRAWRRATASEAASMPLVVATPRNSFRLPLLARAFPNARLRVLHLVRNPAAAANGLSDGWRHRGFFSCRVPGGLRIRGYSDRAPAWGRSWWCYDVPPGWREWTDSSLAEVCGFQWRAAHEATLAEAERLGLPRHRLAFEDVVAGGARRARALDGLADWLGIPASALRSAAAGELPVVMATEPPRPGRWRARARALAPVLADRRIAETAERLGYGSDPGAWD